MNSYKNTNVHQITTILFDVGGVLLTDFIEKKVIDLARKYGVNSSVLMRAKEEYRPLADKGQISDTDFWERVLNSANIKATENDWNLDSYMEEIDGGIELARKLKQNGYQIAILSNDSKQMSEQRRAKYGFDSLFYKIFISSSFGVVKPDPEIFEIALNELKVSPWQCVFIDDRKENIETGQQIGIHSVLFKNSNQAINELNKIGLELPLP